MVNKFNFILEQVFCDNCNSCHDLDLVRDSMVFKRQDGTYSIECGTCFKPYNKKLLESIIIKNLNGIIINYFQQDFVCVKCKNVNFDIKSNL